MTLLSAFLLLLGYTLLCVGAFWLIMLIEDFLFGRKRREGGHE